MRGRERGPDYYDKAYSGKFLLEEHNLLIFSYAFPPIASSGTFRVARFVKYLPEFGWRPIVVTPKSKHAM